MPEIVYNETASALYRKLILIAESQIYPKGGKGTYSTGYGSIKYGPELGRGTGAWCANFVDWCFYKLFQGQGGLSKAEQLLGKYSSPSCTTAAGQYKNHNRLVTTPQPGDQVFYYIGGGYYGHTGIVKSVYSGGIVTIEGNVTIDKTTGLRGVLEIRRPYGAYYDSSTRFGRINWGGAIDLDYYNKIFSIEGTHAKYGLYDFTTSSQGERLVSQDNLDQLKNFYETNYKIIAPDHYYKIIEEATKKVIYEYSPIEKMKEITDYFIIDNNKNVIIKKENINLEAAAINLTAGQQIAESLNGEPGDIIYKYSNNEPEEPPSKIIESKKIEESTIEENKIQEGNKLQVSYNPNKTPIYRIRKSWQDISSQVGAFINFNLALDKLSSLNKDSTTYHLYNQYGMELIDEDIYKDIYSFVVLKDGFQFKDSNIKIDYNGSDENNKIYIQKINGNILTLGNFNTKETIGEIDKTYIEIFIPTNVNYYTIGPEVVYKDAAKTEAIDTLGPNSFIQVLFQNDDSFYIVSNYDKPTFGWI